MEYLSVRNWEKYQHYSKRRPPWIKLYVSIMCSVDVQHLSDTCKWHVVCLFMLASQHDNKIPFDKVWIKHAINAKSRIKWDLVLGSGLFECKQYASKVLAGCKQDARPETETETYTTTPLPPTRGDAASQVRLPTTQTTTILDNKRRDEAFEVYAASFKTHRSITYRKRAGDFVQLAGLRKFLGINAKGVPEGWTVTVENYFGTPQGKYTLADLCSRYDVFLLGSLDRYGKPESAGNGIHEQNLKTLQRFVARGEKDET